MTVLDCLTLMGADHKNFVNILDEEISIITDNSKHIEKNCVFVCIEGKHFDGHIFAEKAIQEGALFVVCQKNLNIKNSVIVENTADTLSILTQALYNNPLKSMELIGVTGTNGKTTISFMLKGILDSLKIKSGLIGTVRNELGALVIPSKFTTPAPQELAELFVAMKNNNVKKIAMEVSSQALAQGRVAGLEFEIGIFTNLTQDHLDYHGTMQEYFDAKRILAEQSKLLLVNIDDVWGKKLYEQYKNKTLTFSEKDNTADYYASNITATKNGMAYELTTKGTTYSVEVPVFGGFSIMNSMQAIAAIAENCGDISAAIEIMKSFSGVPGRIELLYSDDDFKIIRDYAHTPSAIESVVHDFKTYINPKRMVVLFGCAGNRDRTKRVDMTRAAASCSDFVVLTSDNPRDEDEIQIIEDALPGLEESSVEYIVIPDRYTAIMWAIDNHRDGDLLLLLGKGHEDYQVLKDGTIYFDESVIIPELMEQAERGKLLGDI